VSCYELLHFNTQHKVLYVYERLITWFACVITQFIGHVMDVATRRWLLGLSVCLCVRLTGICCSSESSRKIRFVLLQEHGKVVPQERLVHLVNPMKLNSV
jgi:hypothetical protein